MKTKILKFGGSSIRTTQRIKNVIGIIQDLKTKNEIRGVVFSAFGGITDQLIEISHQAAKNQGQYKLQLNDIEARHLKAIDELCGKENRPALREHVLLVLQELKDTLHGVFLVKELSTKTLDFVMGFGERLSCTIISEALNASGLETSYLDMRTLIATDERFGNARVDVQATYMNIRNHFSEHSEMQIITGFIGSTSKGETTTLGRGGSDLTASLVGAALKVDSVELWSDVAGVLTADPNKVGKAFSIDSLTYEEAMELSHFGARIIYPPTIQPASELGIPIYIRNTLEPSFPGTVIGRKSDSNLTVKGISSIDDIALMRVQGSGLIGVAGISKRLFGTLAKNQISVILISQASSEHSICFAVTPENAEKAKKTLEDEFALEITAKQVEKVIIETGLSIVAIVGENMRHATGIAGRCFTALGKNGVNISAIAQGSSELNISVVIDREDESKALNALHEAFFLSETLTMNIFLLGTGTIGGTLIEQMIKQSPFLRENCNLDMKMIGIGNVDGMLFNAGGLTLDNCLADIKTKGEPVSVNGFVEEMIALNLPNSVFVDCTGIYDIVDHYQAILGHSISIVTPNKIANSGPYARYAILRETAAKHGVKFLYETNVGAGLPVISTLNDLMASGDRIVKMEAVLSGTLSYIFNRFDRENTFSDVVKDAREKGLSEPDPRDDLSGLDVARKLLILAREIGLSLEPGDIQLEPLLPDSCVKAPSIEDFFTELDKLNGDFESRRQNAEDKGQKLCYMALISDGKAGVSLQQVDASHPFYTLSASDNMIVFTTERYKERPLVIKGPGAGAEVTAAGVFADIIRIANYLK